MGQETGVVGLVGHACNPRTRRQRQMGIAVCAGVPAAWEIETRPHVPCGSESTGAAW